MTEPAHPATRATVAAYLARIGVDHVGPPTQASLARLQQAHMLHVPFESLSIGWGEQIELDEAWLLDKIVGRRRGGFCYELNGAFAWLLRQLGFHVDMLEAQVWSADDQTFSPPFDHMTLAVRADDATHLVDVGFGRAPRAPMRWPEDRQTGVDGTYRLHAADGQGCLESRTDDATWRPEYRFSTTPRRLDDYRAMCAYHQTSPDSHFARNRVCSLATVDGRITLTPREFIVTRNGARNHAGGG
ncbi:MAG: arylamine N-acetyltransferase [Caldilineaceae bacterium]